jgi:hypothetical protein
MTGGNFVVKGISSSVETWLPGVAKRPRARSRFAAPHRKIIVVNAAAQPIFCQKIMGLAVH